MFAVARSVYWSLVHNILLVVAALWPQCVCVCVCVLVPWIQFHNCLCLYPVALKQMWKWGAPIRRKGNSFVVSLHFFGSKSTIIRQYSFVVFWKTAFLLTVPPCLDICISGGTWPVPYEVGATAVSFSVHVTPVLTEFTGRTVLSSCY